MNNKILKNRFRNCVLMILAGAILPACSDLLDEVVYSELTTDNAFTTEKDAVAAVNAIYQPLISVTNRSIFYLNDMTTDACYMKEVDCELLNENKMNVFQDIPASWNGYYRIVSRANIAIDKIPGIEDSEFDEDVAKAQMEKSKLIAEAYFMRAFAYYQLSDLFYTVPLILSSDTPVDAVIPPSSVELIDAQIESDIAESKKYLPESYDSNLDAGRCTYGAACAMLTRLHMRAAGRTRLAGNDASLLWRKALESVNEVLKLEGSVYSLQPHVWDVFNPETDATLYNNELIFAVRASMDIPSGSSDIGMNFTPWDYDMGWNLFSIPLELTWMYDSRDERYSELMVTGFRNVYDKDDTPQQRYYAIPESVEKVGTVYTETPARRTFEMEASYTKKYKYLRPGTYNYNTCNNMSLIRLADMILCKAEIQNELEGPTQESVDLINRIRTRAFQNENHNLKLADFPTTESFREALCDERLLELNNEGVRRPDLIRMGLWKDRFDKYVAAIKTKSEWREKNASGTKPDYSADWKVYPSDLTENDKRRYFPVPKRESDLNPLLLNCRDF